MQKYDDFVRELSLLNPDLQRFSTLFHKYAENPDSFPELIEKEDINLATKYILIGNILRIYNRIENFSYLLIFLKNFEPENLLKSYFYYKILESIPSFLAEKEKIIEPITYQSLIKETEELKKTYQDKLPKALIKSTRYY